MGLHRHLWLCVRGVDLVYIGYESEETLTTLIKYKSSRLGPKTLTNVFSTQRAPFWGPPMAENSPLDVSAWIRRLGPNLKYSIAPYSLSCIFPYHQIRVDEPFLCTATNYWVLTWHVFRFNGVELCPHYRRIWCHHGWIKDWRSHLPYHEWGSPLFLVSYVGRPSCYGK